MGSSACALLLLTLAAGAECARILAMLPYNARSHFVVMQPLLLALHDRGHDLTVVSSFPLKPARPGFRDIDLSDILPVVVSNYTIPSIRKDMPNVFRTMSFIIQIHMEVCEKVYAEKRVMALLNEKFDLMIGEIFGSDCFNYIAYKMNIPFISWVTSTVLPWTSDRTGLTDNPAYIPNYFMDYGEDMWIWQRLWNSLTLLYAKTVYYLESELPSRELAERALGVPLPPMKEVNKMTSLVFVNSYFSLVQSRPFTPNVVEVGGIHIKKASRLPSDLQKVLDDAGPRGVVVVSFGSLVKLSSLPWRAMSALLRALSQLDRQVIMKFEDNLHGLRIPANVVIKEWLPQADLVAHKRVVALVTHCGLASTIEAVHYAKPIVAIPFFSDQHQNARQVVSRGGGILLDANALTADRIRDSINKVITESSYAENMREMSKQFRDRPHSPMETAIYWTEYVIRHEGAPQLRPASLKLPLLHYLLVDVFLFKVLIAFLLLMLSWLIVRCLRSKCCRRCCPFVGGADDNADEHPALKRD